MKKRKGFTLIEILIVAAVVAILAVGVVALVSTTLTNLKSISTAVERIIAEGGTWPTSTTSLLTVIQTLPDCSSAGSTYFVATTQTDLLTTLVGNQYVGCTIHGYLEALGTAVTLPASGVFSW
jgi:prepilin-type N-terminal cleavage/methylation domain-containing protein